MEFDAERAAAWGREMAARMRESERRIGYIAARLRLYDLAHGGRSHPLPTGSPAAWHFGEHNAKGTIVVHDGPLLIEGADLLDPGDAADVRIHPLRPDLWPGRTPGVTFYLWEGHLIGEATVIEAVAPSLPAAT